MDQHGQLPVFQGFVIYLEPKDLSNLILTNRKFAQLTENKGVMKEYNQKYQEVILEASFWNDKCVGRIRTRNHLIEYDYVDEFLGEYGSISNPDDLSFLVGRSLKIDQIKVDDNELVLPLDGKEKVSLYFFFRVETYDDSSDDENNYIQGLYVDLDGKPKWFVEMTKC